MFLFVDILRSLAGLYPYLVTADLGSIIKQVALNKSNLVLLIKKQNISTLQLFTEIITMERIYDWNLNAKLDALGDNTKWSN
jgi:hypothetical protein